MFHATLRLAGMALIAVAAGCGLTVTGVFGGTELDGSTPGDAASDVTTADVVDPDAPPGDAGSEADVNVTDGGGPCPMAGGVRVAAGFCIDGTEVTNAAYAQFLAAIPDAAAQPSECAWNTTFVPVGDWPPAATAQNLPVDYLDWCDAYAYCQWAGRRLCGKIGGGGAAVNGFKDAGESQWFHACSHGDDGSHAYPYGNSYNVSTCNGPSLARADAGAMASCVGGYPGIVDMSGNVWEWEDSCTGDAGAGDSCRIRGGSWSDTAYACNRDLTWLRSNVGQNIGLRCCAD